MSARSLTEIAAPDQHELAQRVAVLLGAERSQDRDYQTAAAEFESEVVEEVALPRGQRIPGPEPPFFAGLTY